MRARGMTLIEVLLAMFVLLVGIVGVLSAIPTGIASAQTVILQDAAIHLAHSKFTEFRRDRVDPSVDLAPKSSYLTSQQEPVNSSSGEWRDFAHGPGQTYEYFDSIERYEWNLATQPIKCSATHEPGSSGADIGLTKVTITVREKGTQREFEFVEYLTAYVAR